MITSSGAEGINLRNTRFVHIVEPYWHNVSVEQVVGRIPENSHLHLANSSVIRYALLMNTSSINLW